MPLILQANRPKAMKINRSSGGDGVVRIDGEACCILEEMFEKLGGGYSVKELVSVLIKHAADDAVIKTRGGESDE